MSAPLLQPCDVRGTANRSAGIRAFLRDRGPSTAKEVCLGLGITDNYTGGAVRASLRSMTLDGILARHNETNPCKYSVIREPAARSSTPRAERRAETYRNKAALAYQNAEAAYRKWREESANNPMTISERIREIVKRLGTASADDIYSGLGLTATVGRVRLYSIVHGQVRDGLLGRTTERPYRYHWLRDADPSLRPKRPPTAKAIDRAAQREARDARREERRIARNQARIEKLEAHRREVEKRRQQRKQEAMARAEAKAKARAPHIAVIAAAAERRATKAVAAPVQVEAETVDAWMERTGKRPEILPHSFDSPITSFPGRRPSLSKTAAIP